MAAPTPAIEPLATARFRTVKTADPIEVTVHFNPASLQYTVSNTLKNQGSGSKKKQYVSQTTAKLTMEVVFDTTASGDDVRDTTDKMARMLQPHGPSGKQVPPLVEFGWGVYRFTGMVEQYKETLDFFSASGVPLRSTVSLTLASQDVVFESSTRPGASVDGNLAPEPVTIPTSPGSAGGPAAVASALGNPEAARAIAAANDAASLRFSARASLAVGVGAGVTLAPAAAFSAGASAGFGASASAGFGVSGGAGFSAGAGVTAGAGFGASAAGGVSIGADAGGDFSGLRAAASITAAAPDARAALALTTQSTPAAGAQVALGGRVQAGGSASLGADVGADTELTARLRFGDGRT